MKRDIFWRLEPHYIVYGEQRARANSAREDIVRRMIERIIVDLNLAGKSKNGVQAMRIGRIKSLFNAERRKLWQISPGPHNQKQFKLGRKRLPLQKKILNRISNAAPRAR